MPELPEVETVRKGLVSLVKNKTIAKVDVYWPRIIEFPEIDIFQQQLIGETIETVDRRGKYLIFEFTHYEMVSHLRMEGKYEFFDQPTALDKHSHVRFIFTDGSELIYHDVRKFGRMALLKKGTAKEYKGLTRLGPEPTDADFDLADFKVKLKKASTMIKPLLLNQKIVAGLGNIYVDEVLWLAKIHPEQPANTLSSQSALGEAGHFQQELHVYGQTGEPCSRCGTPIIKIKVAQRGTHLCPHCQKLKKV